MVPLPRLTDDQRRAALDKAAAARATRAEVKDRLRAGSVTLAEVFDLVSADEAIAKLRAVDLLQAMPGVGRVTAHRLMERHDIALSRRLRGLGPHQRAALIAEFTDHD